MHPMAARVQLVKEAALDNPHRRAPSNPFCANYHLATGATGVVPRKVDREGSGLFRGKATGVLPRKGRRNSSARNAPGVFRSSEFFREKSDQSCSAKRNKSA